MKKAFICVLILLGQHGFVAAGKTTKNVIVLIGDGMGFNQLYAGILATNKSANVLKCTTTGFMTTLAANKIVPDNCAASTALSCGIKTNNGLIGMNPDSTTAESVLETVKKKGFVTGIITTSSVTQDATAAFYAHQLNKNAAEKIALDFVKSDIDLLIGGGRKYFDNRDDSLNLISQLQQKGYTVASDIGAVSGNKNTKLLGLLYDDQPPVAQERSDMLAISTQNALKVLSKNKKGFVLVVQGAQIDWACHDNNASDLLNEFADFDKAVGCAIDFAAKDKNTLVVVCAGFETGGMYLTDDTTGKAKYKACFATKLHTGAVVPVLSFGPGSEHFSGIMENSSVKGKLLTILKITH